MNIKRSLTKKNRTQGGRLRYLHQRRMDVRRHQDPVVTSIDVLKDGCAIGTSFKREEHISAIHSQRPFTSDQLASALVMEERRAGTAKDRWM